MQPKGGCREVQACNQRGAAGQQTNPPFKQNKLGGGEIVDMMVMISKHSTCSHSSCEIIRRNSMTGTLQFAKMKIKILGCLT